MENSKMMKAIKMRGIAKFAIVMLLGFVVTNGVFGALKVSTTKATEIGEKITVTITTPDGASFKKGSWTGPGGLTGTLEVGENEVILSKFSENKNDYVFLVKWIGSKEPNGEELKQVTLYRHIQTTLLCISRSNDKGRHSWLFYFKGIVSPLDTELKVSLECLTKACFSFSKDNIQFNENKYLYQVEKRLNLDIEFNVRNINARASIDNVLLKEIKNGVAKASKIPITRILVLK